MSTVHAAGKAEALPRVPDLADLRARLETALRAGADTAAVRGQIAAAEAAERRREATEARTAEAFQRRVAADRADTLERAATAIFRPIVDRLAAQLAALAPPPEISPPSLWKAQGDIA